MAEQDESQTGKPDTPPSAPAVPPPTPKAQTKSNSASGSLSAAAEAAAAKIEASILASRAAEVKKEAEAKQAAETKRAAAATKAAEERKQAAAKEPAAEKKPAGGAKPTEAKPESMDTRPPAAKPATVSPDEPAGKKGDASAPQPEAPATPAAKPEAQESRGAEDVIAMIPVAPRSEAGKVSVSSAPAAPQAPAAAHAEQTRALPRSAAAGPGSDAGSPPETAVAEARSRVSGAHNPGPELTPAALERRAAREAALDAKPPLARTLQVLLAIFYPFILLIAAIRFIASPIFLWIVYQRPGFPSDSFGFSTADRMTYGSYGVDFLNNVADNRYLGELRDAAGDPLFLGTEVQHMADVKNVMSFTYLAWAIMGVIVIFALAYLGKRYSGGIRRGLFAGSVATLVLLAGLATAAILGWEKFFTTFHEVFFSQGNWTFNYSDTLIRLYPPQFWVDAAITIGGLVLITSLLTLIFTWPTARRREASRLRQDSRVFGL